MTSAPNRQIRGRLTLAERCAPRFAKARASRLSPAQANGIRYENKVHRALAVLAKRLPAVVEKNPWFHYIDANGHGACSPDAILWLSDLGVVLVIEIKYTWVPTAEAKLKNLYLPVVNVALEPIVLRSLVICKSLTPDAPKPIDAIGEGTLFSSTSSPVYQWLGQGPLIW